MSDGEHDDVHGDFHDPEVAVFGKSAALYRPRECVFCSESSRELKTLSAMVYHLNSTHNLQIQNIGSIVPFISDYLRAYALEIDICGNAATALVLGANECDLERRERMRREFLSRLLIQQQLERRGDSLNGQPYSRKCLFCKAVFNRRPDLFNHMYSGHSLNIGLLDNLVDVDAFLDILSDRLSRLVCIYCERTFKDAAVLRKHMRKKRHFKVNPQNPVYDRFYMVNYLNEPLMHQPILSDRHQQQHQNNYQQRPTKMPLKAIGTSTGPDDDLNESKLMTMASVAEEESWSDWDETLDEQCQCLLCDQILPSGEECINKHMPAKHGVELLGVLQRRGYQDFYDRVKLVNFIRRSIQQCRQCFHCHVSLDRPEEADHFSRESQCSSSLPSIQEAKEIFLNDARYLLPAIDNDPLLRCLEVVMVETEEDCTEINELTVQTHERLTISASEIK